LAKVTFEWNILELKTRGIHPGKWKIRSHIPRGISNRRAINPAGAFIASLGDIRSFSQACNGKKALSDLLA
jgi:hypothetical protein